MHTYNPAALAHIRRAAGLSRSEVARALGVTRYAVDSWESGRRLPGVDRLGVLADLLGVGVAAFYGRGPGGV